MDPEVKDDLKAEEGGDIGATLRAAFEKSTEAPPASADATAPESGQASPASGKEASAPAAQGAEAGEGGKAPAAAPGAPGQPPAGAEGEGQQLAPEAKARLDRIPVGWRGGAASWHALPVEAKQYIVDRNSNIDRAMQQNAPAVQFAQSIHSVFAPYEGLLRSRGADPVGTARYLMDGYAQLLFGTPQQKHQILTSLANEAGVDLGQVQAGAPPQADPEVAALRQQLAHLAGVVTQQQTAAQTAEQQALTSEIDAFANDPQHPHFQRVRGPMAAILMAKQAQGLQDAYDKACWADPEIRASLMAQHEAQALEKRKKEAEAAKRAAVSVTGSPSGTATAGLGELSLRGALEQQFFGSAGRV